MNGLAMMLKAFGVNVSPEHIAAVEVLIPQIPAKLQEAVSYINGNITRFDLRMKALESAHDASLQLLEDIRKELHGIADSSGTKSVSRPGTGTGTRRTNGGN
jgi:hypothetical protein